MEFKGTDAFFKSAIISSIKLTKKKLFFLSFKKRFFECAPSIEPRRFLESSTVNHPNDNFRYADTILGKTDGWLDAPQATLPEWYGYNHIQLQEANEFQMFFGFEGDAVGSQGTPARYEVYVATPNGYMRMDLDEINTGEAIVEGFSMIGSGVLSVMAYGETYVEGETFSYRYAMTPSSMNSEGSKGPLGCQSLSAHILWALWGGFFTLVWRRKRK